ncbi:hypothetical protein [Leisingera sp. ANG59]|uniref:hypothetical protein n=1 Tax=Leisingera sp. ANG59 TaxID=2675221 RepID=UPI001571F415|nr:hypothetical protein [Leisingera sp. ANG59]
MPDDMDQLKAMVRAMAAKTAALEDENETLKARTATTKATWVTRSGFPTDLSFHWASGKTGEAQQGKYQSHQDRHASDGSPSHHSNGNR